MALFVSTQTTSPLTLLNTDYTELSRDRSLLEKAVSKCSRVQALQQGVVHFWTSNLRKEILSVDKKSAPFLSWACEQAIDILQFISA